MKIWIDRLTLAVMVALVVWLSVTAIPSLTSDHLGGTLLLQHMVASGGLVVLLPIFALLGLRRMIDPARSGALQRLGYWALVVTGLLTIATMFICMLPIASTEVMHHLIQWHGYAGFAMVAALLVFSLGVARLRMQSKRSERPG